MFILKAKKYIINRLPYDFFYAKKRKYKSKFY